MLPTYREIEEPLIEELQRRGGSSRPSDRRNGRTVYEALARYFDLTSADLGETIYENGKPRSKWKNMVRYARRSLVDQGRIDNTQHGVWRLKD